MAELDEVRTIAIQRCTWLLQGPGDGKKPPVRAKMGETNKFVYDEEVRCRSARMLDVSLRLLSH